MKKTDDMYMNIEDENPIDDEEYYDFEEELERKGHFEEETSEYYM